MPLVTQGTMGISTLPLLCADVDHLSTAVQGDISTPCVAQVYQGDTDTPDNLAERLTLIQRQRVQNLTLIQR